MNKTIKVVAFLLAVLAGILAISTAPVATVAAWLAAVLVLIPTGGKND